MQGLWGGVTLGNFLNGLKSFFIAIWIGTWRHSFNLTLPTLESLEAKQRDKFFNGLGDRELYKCYVLELKWKIDKTLKDGNLQE